MNEEGREGRPPQRAEAMSTEPELGSYANSKRVIIFGVFKRTRTAQNRTEQDLKMSRQVDAGFGQRPPLCFAASPRCLPQCSGIFCTEMQLNVTIHLEKIKLKINACL